MKQNLSTQDCYFQSALPSQRAEEFLGHSPPLPYLEPLNQDIQHFLSLETPQPYCKAYSQAESSMPDYQTNAYREDDMAASENSAPSSPSNVCSLTISSTHSGGKDEVFLPFLRLVPEQPGSRIKEMIQLLIDKSQLKKQILDAQGKQFCQGDQQMYEVFQILALKFKGSKKTKEEMVKYCMRKAFKFVGELNRKQKSNSLTLDQYMKEYCAQKEGPYDLPVPFKKHSADKTMNTNFINKVFASEQFSKGYHLFLEQFDALAAEDNERKISYLTSQVQHALTNGQVRHLQKIKRLPWTRTILKKAKQLALNLLEGNETPRCRKSK